MLFNIISALLICWPTYPPLSSKSKICNVLDFGAVADNSTDIGPAILSAFSKCAKAGGATIYIPPGSYSMETGVILKHGGAYAIQIDGLITLKSDGSFAGNAIIIQNAQDVEVFSSNGLGAMNGQGYIKRTTSSGQNARLLRFISCSDISSRTWRHTTSLFADQTYCIGGTDGIDVTCTDNCYLHDIEVTNRDECISVKSPSNNILIEDIYCNHSGGMSIGSLTANVANAADANVVSNITMRNINSLQCTGMLMIKTFPGGTGATGYVKDYVFENFWAYDTTYALDIDQYWYNHNTPNTGAVALSGLTFSNWTGTMKNGASRGAIVIRGSDIVPAVDITLKDFSMWTVNGNKVVNQCKNLYGSGYCARVSTASPLPTFTASVTSTSSGWGIPGYGTKNPIPVYTPAAFWKLVSSGLATFPSRTTSLVKSTSSASSSHKTSSVLKARSVPVSTSKASAPVSSSIKVSSTRVSISSSITASSASNSTAQSSLAQTPVSTFTPTPTTILAIASSPSSSSSSSASVYFSSSNSTFTISTSTLSSPISISSALMSGNGSTEMPKTETSALPTQTAINTEDASGADDEEENSCEW